MILTPFDPTAFAPIAALLAQEPPVAASARVLPIASEPAEPRLTADEAVRMLPMSDVVHVIADAGRERWDRARVREVLHRAAGIRLTLPATRAVGFGIAVDRRGGGTLVIETDRGRVADWLAAQADRPTKE